MLKEQAMDRVSRIRDAAGDYEIAHGMEDALFYEFILDVANSNSLFSAAAQEVLKSRTIDFARHCA